MTKKHTYAQSLFRFCRYLILEVHIYRVTLTPHLHGKGQKVYQVHASLTGIRYIFELVQDESDHVSTQTSKQDAHRPDRSDPGGGGGYFGLRSYGDVPTFRVDFLTQNILDRVQN